MKITISHNFPDIARKIETLGQDIAGKAIASALNKTVAQAKTAMSSEIRKEFVISADKVRDSLQVNRASARAGRFSLEASLESKSKRGRSLNMINFMEKFVTLAQAKKRKRADTLNKLFVQIKRGGGRKSLGKAFIGNKGRTVFVRTGKTRLPIKPMQTIGVPSMFNTKRVNAVVMQMIRTKFPEIFFHEAKFFTDRFNSK
jgi:hypothetical protein